MFISNPLWLTIVATSCVQARYLAKELSFGQTGKISERHDGVPYFKLLGDPNPPEIYSNKLILTPPVRGNQRSSIWGEQPLEHTEWTADIDFRATGSERGGGKLQIWLTKDGHKDIDSGSIYTAGKFDGLALVIDTYGNSGGMVRGFLNDGNTGYSSHHSVDSLAFGHCQYPYRNLGRPSQIKIRQDTRTFKVEVDGQMCFMSTNIRVPSNYYFGISAVSAEQPDSFEVFKLVVTTDLHIPAERSTQETAQDQQQRYASDTTKDDLPSMSADKIAETDHSTDTRSRLQAIMKHLTEIQTDISRFVRTSDNRYSEAQSSEIKPVSYEQVQSLERRMAGIESSIERILVDVGDKDYLRLHGDLKKTLLDSQGQLLEGVSGRVYSHIKSSTPRMGFYVFIVLGFQAFLALSYVLYKRQRANAPKKYL